LSDTTSVRSSTDESDGGTAAVGIPHRRLILGALAAALVGALATWLIAFSSVFGVHTVSVRGVHALTADQVRTVADIATGTPLVRLDTDAIRRRVEALPDVAAATVTTSLPSTVVITVRERVAVGVVQAAGGYLLVDRTGDQFRPVALRPPRLPLFVVSQGSGARATGSAVAAVAGALPSSLRGRIASVQALDPSTVTLLMKDGRVVRWGSATRDAAKARVLPALLRLPGTQFDVTDPDQPFSR
jgi:cell division protein FtsQ